MRGARALTAAEVRRTARELHGCRDRALFLLMLYTGARISEALALDVVDVVREGVEPGIRRQIVFRRRNTKGKRTSRAIDVHPDLAVALFVYLGEEPASTRPLFLSRELRRMSRTTGWRVLNEAFIAAGLGERVSPHSLRKTFAQRLHERGTLLPVIQELLGHENVQDTIEYFKVSEVECAAAIHGLPGVELEPEP